MTIAVGGLGPLARGAALVTAPALPAQYRILHILLDDNLELILLHYRRRRIHWPLSCRHGRTVRHRTRIRWRNHFCRSLQISNRPQLSNTVGEDGSRLCILSEAG